MAILRRKHTTSHVWKGGKARLTYTSYGDTPSRAIESERTGRRIPFAAAFLILMVFLATRIAGFAYLGPAGYADRMEALEDGNAVETLIARAMPLDPVSVEAAITLRRLLNDLPFVGL